MTDHERLVRQMQRELLAAAKLVPAKRRQTFVHYALAAYGYEYPPPPFAAYVLKMARDLYH